MLRRNNMQRCSYPEVSCHPDVGCAKVSPERRYLQKPQGVACHNTVFFMVTAVKTSNLTKA
jgi:hypothetical protein